jgi:ribonuclease HII
MAAAVVFPQGVPAPLAALLDDSKALSARQRELAFTALVAARASGIAEYAVAAASAREIGRLNILGATHLAMRRAQNTKESHHGDNDQNPRRDFHSMNVTYD